MRRRRSDDAMPCLCGGVGYMQRVTDRAMVKCLLCDGTGVRKAGPEHKPFSVAPPVRTADEDDPWRIA